MPSPFSLPVIHAATCLVFEVQPEDVRVIDYNVIRVRGKRITQSQLDKVMVLKATINRIIDGPYPHEFFEHPKHRKVLEPFDLNHAVAFAKRMLQEA